MQAVIFDMDGVILESEPLHDEAARRVYSEQGFGEAADIQPFLNDFRGCTEVDFWSFIKKEFSIDVPLEDFLQWKEEAFLSIIANETLAPSDGLIATLDALKEKQFPIALASSSSYSAIDAIIDGLELRSYFTVIVSGDDVEKGKPEPDIFLLAAEKLGVEPAECIVIEDSSNGVKAANAANMKSVGYYGSPSNTQDLAEAHVTMQHFDELTEVLQ